MNDKILVEHMEADAAFQQEQRAYTAEQLAFKAETEGHLARLEEKIDGLATKDDIKELKKFMKDVQIGVGFVRVTWNNLGQIGSLLGLIVAAMLFFKLGFSGLVAFFTGSSHPQ